MMVQVYRIDRSLMGKLGRALKKPDLPVMAGSIGNAFKVFRDVTTENVYVLHDDTEIKRFRDPTGRSLIANIYYIRHPKAQRTNCLIPASHFHKHIVQEQISEIISYIRSNTRVKKLKICIAHSAGCKLEARSIFEDLPIEGKVELKFSSLHEVSIESVTPLKPSEKRKEYVWMDDFVTTITAVDEITSAQLKITERFDLSFGMALNLAKQIGVSADFLAAYEYKLECEFG